jgi:hypothetical protein
MAEYSIARDGEGARGKNPHTLAQSQPVRRRKRDNLHEAKRMKGRKGGCPRGVQMVVHERRKRGKEKE